MADLTTSREEPASVVSVHEKVLSFLSSAAVVSSTTQLTNATEGGSEARAARKRLRELQQRRIYIASEVATARSKNQLSRHNLLHVLDSHQVDNDESNKFDCATEVLASLFASPLNGDSDDDDDATNYASLAQATQQVRKKRKLIAAYRLGGISASLPHAMPGVLAVRFDCCLEGVYVACYHVFFDLVVQDSNNDKDDAPKRNLFLRLTQHTIPSAIPFQELKQSTLGGSHFFLGDLHQPKDSWHVDKLKQGMELWTKQCYRACVNWERRKQSWSCLEQRQRSCKMYSCSCTGTCPGHLRVTSLTTTALDALNRISFELSKEWCKQRESLPIWQIQCCYESWEQGLPTEVKVSECSGSKGDSTGRNGMASQIRAAFANHQLEGALDLVDEIWQRHGC